MLEAVNRIDIGSHNMYVSVGCAQSDGWQDDRQKQVHQKYVTVFDRLCVGVRLRSEKCFMCKLLEGGI